MSGYDVCDTLAGRIICLKIYKIVFSLFVVCIYTVIQYRPNSNMIMIKYHYHRHTSHSMIVHSVVDTKVWHRQLNYYKVNITLVFLS